MLLLMIPALIQWHLHHTVADQCMQESLIFSEQQWGQFGHKEIQGQFRNVVQDGRQDEGEGCRYLPATRV